MKKNLLSALAVIAGYLMICLAGHIFETTTYLSSATGVFLENSSRQSSYLFGWLLQENLFWIAMAVSVIPSLFGKKFFSFTILSGFAIGLITGELWGHNPPGEAYGHGHYGWAIWIFIFLFSIVMGIVLEKSDKGRIDLRSRRLWIWTGIYIAGIAAILLGIRLGMPVSFNG